MALVPVGRLADAVGDALKADTTVVSYVSSRVYYVAAPQDTLHPFLLFSVEDVQTRHEFATDGIEANVVLDAWDISESGAVNLQALSDAGCSALHRTTQTASGSTFTFLCQQQGAVSAQEQGLNCRSTLKAWSL